MSLKQKFSAFRRHIFQSQGNVVLSDSGAGVSLENIIAGLKAEPPLVSKCVEHIAQAVGSSEVRVVDSGTWEQVDGAIPSLLRTSPDGVLPSATFFAEVAASLARYGNAFLRPVRVAGELTRLDLYPGQRPTVGGNGVPVFYLQDAEGQTQLVARSDIIHIRLPSCAKVVNVRDSVLGPSPVARIQSICRELATLSATRELILNGQRPLGEYVFRVGSSNASALEDQRKRFDNYSAKGSKPVALATVERNAGTDLQPLGAHLTLDGLQKAALELKQDISRGLGVPPALLGLESSATKTQYPEATELFIGSTLDAYCSAIEGALNVALYRGGLEQRVWLSRPRANARVFVELMRGSNNNSAAITINEGRRALGLSGISQGTELWENLNE